MKLKNVKVIDKPERGRHENRDFYERASEIAVYNVFDQSWESLETEGLTHLFNNDKAEFERRKEAVAQNN